jgi:hypothetical protein
VSEYNMKHRTKDIVQLEIACAYPTMGNSS